MNNRHIADVQTVSLASVNARREATNRLERLYNDTTAFHKSRTEPEIVAVGIEEEIEKPEFVEAFLNETVYTGGDDSLAIVNLLAGYRKDVAVYIIVNKRYHLRIKGLKPTDENMWHCDLYDGENEAIIVKSGSPILIYVG